MRRRAGSVSAVGIVLILVVSTLALVSLPSVRRAEATEQKYFTIYYEAAVTSGTSYVNLLGQVTPITGGESGVYSYVPATNSTDLIATSASQSYSPSTFDVYTAGDRVYLITMYQISMTTGDETAVVQEIDLDTGHVTGQCCTGFWDYEPQTTAAVNDSFYFHPGLWYEVATGQWDGNGFYVANLTNNKETELLSSGSSQNYGTLLSNGYDLFRYQFSSENATVSCSVTCFLNLNQINLETGQNEEGVQLSLPGSSYYNGTFSNWSFAANKTELYIATKFEPNQPGGGTNFYDSPSVWVYTIPLAEFESGSIPDGPSNYWFDTISAFVPIPTTTTPVGLASMQAAAGDLLLNMGNSLVVYTMPPASCSTFQSCTGNDTVISGNKNDVSLVYAPLMPNAQASSTSKSSSSTGGSASVSLTTPSSKSSSSVSSTTPPVVSTSSAASTVSSPSTTSKVTSSFTTTYALAEVAVVVIILVAFGVSARRRTTG